MSASPDWSALQNTTFLSRNLYGYNNYTDNRAEVDGDRHLGRQDVCDGWKVSQNGTDDVTDKATGEVLATIANAGPADVREACKLAVKEGRSWAAVPADERAAILRRAGEILDQYKD
jgi:Aldehyde dehydrogenase family